MVSGFLHALSSALAFLCTSHQIFLNMAGNHSNEQDSTSDLHPFQIYQNKNKMASLKLIVVTENIKRISYFSTSFQSFQQRP